MDTEVPYYDTIKNIWIEHDNIKYYNIISELRTQSAALKVVHRRLAKGRSSSNDVS